MKRNICVSFIVLLCFSHLLFAQNYGNWRIVDEMPYKRIDHASILLRDGNILVTGGTINSRGSKNCEIFNVVQEKWEIASPFNKPRLSHNLVMLNSGNIMAIGGFLENSCEILYDNKWVMTDTFVIKRIWGQSSIVLNNGNVLLVGGALFHKTFPILKDCQLFEIEKMKWRLTGELNVPRYFHTITKLQDGRILVTGGYTLGEMFTNTCEIYDPVNEKWILTDTMKEYRASHAAVLLPDGKVLVFGGYRTTTELFDPATEKWTTVGYAPAAEVNGALINNGEYILYIDGPTKYSCGWGIISLKDFSRKYFKLFGKWVYRQTITKIDEKRALINGGYEMKADGEYYVPIAESQLYDYTLTNIQTQPANLNSSSEVKIDSYTNPFNQTTIRFYIPERTDVKLKVFDILGREVKTLTDRFYERGRHEIQFDAGDLSSGIYFYNISTPGKSITKKLLLIR